MDPHYQPYPDNNLTQKTAENSYIYNTEATYVTTVTREPTMAEHIDVNQQWVGDSQNISQNIQYQDPNQTYVQGVDSQYQQNVVVTQDNQSYVLQQDPNTPFITENQTVEVHNQQLYTMAQDGHQTTYVYQQAHVQETYDGQVATDAQYVHQEYTEIPTNHSGDQQPASTTEVQITEIPENEPVLPTEIVEPTDGIIISVSTPDEAPPLEVHPQKIVNDSGIIEVSEVADESLVEEAEVVLREMKKKHILSYFFEEDTEETVETVCMETDSAEIHQEASIENASEAESTLPTEHISEAENVTDEAVLDNEIQKEDTEHVQNEANNPNDDRTQAEIVEDNAETVGDAAQVQNEIVHSVVPASQSNHTPEQALGAMYEFSEETEENINISMSNKSEQMKSTDSSYSEVEGETQTFDMVETNPDQSSEVTEETDNINTNPVGAPKTRRGRKTKGEVPSHLLGIDISKPVETLPNGKAPKPRLGVKVPTRNLTSHIVSKEDIEKEIVERGRRKMESKGQEAFARKLTQRLAKQLAGDGDSSNSPAESSSNSAETHNRVIIENNSDLLAILEGEGDDDASPAVPVLKNSEQPRDPEEIRNMEREIALQQLKELPFMSPRTKGEKFRFISGTMKDLRPPKLLPEPKKLTPSKKRQQDVSGSETSSSPTKSDINPVEVEPQIKVNMALKTYSRKRKSVDPPETSPEKKVAVAATPPIASPVTPAKIDCPVTPAAYVTKSSRVIKKKVIWDPDDELPSAVARTSTKTTSKNEPPPEQSKSPTKPLKTYEKNEKAKSDTPNEQEEITEEAPNKDNKKEDIKEDRDNKKPLKSKEKSVEKQKPVDKQKPVEKAKPTPKKTATQGNKVKKSPKLLKTKKSMSEVDKLLGDEGAIRMLYEIKNDGADGTDEKRKSTRNIISVDKTFKELAKKANEIKSSLVNSTTSEASPPKSLRRKETSSPAPPPPPPIEKFERKSSTTTPSAAAPILDRQKSKDSTRSSLHTPPASPAPSFEASYLIRRRSSSSISDIPADDFDDEHDSDIEIKLPKKRTFNPLSDGPKIKKHKKQPVKEEVNSTVVPKEEVASPAKAAKLENRLGPFTKLSVKKINKQVTVTLELESTKGFLTIEALEELATALNKLSKERECNVVLVRSSQEKTFCLGLDYTPLIAQKETDRKNEASKLANGVSEFLKSLLHFPKVLVAGIQGECVGLGVTILPLFDLVVASDKASFTANYAALGCVAEAGFLLTAPHITNHGLAAELLYSNHKLTADEAHRRGLVSRLCWPEKYMETIKNLLASIAKGSKQSLEATKKQLRKSMIKSTESAIESMSKQLTDHWSSNECQKNFEKLAKSAE